MTNAIQLSLLIKWLFCNKYFSLYSYIHSVVLCQCASGVKIYSPNSPSHENFDAELSTYQVEVWMNRLRWPPLLATHNLYAEAVQAPLNGLARRNTVTWLDTSAGLPTSSLWYWADHTSHPLLLHVCFLTSSPIVVHEYYRIQEI